MADLINDSAFFFEILIGIFPKYFLLLASTGIVNFVTKFSTDLISYVVL